MDKKYIDLDFLKSNEDCKSCDHINDYVCFDCESLQVKNKYPNAQWELPEWVNSYKKEDKTEDKKQVQLSFPFPELDADNK